MARAVSSDGAAPPRSRAAFASVAPSGLSDGGAVGADVRASREPAPVRDLGEIRRRLIENQAGTYIGDILAERDSNIARWPDRLSTKPLRVWIQFADKLPDWNPVYVGQVRDAFTTWVGAGAPVPFTFVNDSSQGDVHVTWVDHFDEQISGKTMWARDDNWWIVDANIAIALHHNHGEPLDASAVRAIALHEVGHLLGLDHCSDTTNIMTPRVRVRELSEADKATMRLIYALPPGSVKQAMAGG
jgi:predicted Zn-dependent protease